MLLTEEHEYATRDEALAVGMRLWRAGRFFEAHECLEDVWHEADPGDRELWKGVIQVAVGCVHDQRDNAQGAVTLLRRAADYLAPYPSPHHGIDTAGLSDRALAMARRVEEEGTGSGPHPSVPTTPDGPYVGDAPDDGPHPLRDDPVWRRPPRTDRPDDSTTDGATP